MCGIASSLVSSVATAGWLLATLAAAHADPAEVVLRAPGTSLVAVAPAGDGLTLGAAQPARRGAAPEAGQIAVEIDPPGLAPWAKVRIVERTALPVDFVITGYIDRIKIDEIEICGRTGERIEAKIAAGARKLSLNRFSIHPAGAPCPAPTPAAQ